MCLDAVLPCSNDGVLLRLCSLGLLSFWDTILAYFFKSAPPPPFWEGSVGEAPEASGVAAAAAEDEAAFAELPALEDEDKAANSDPGGSDRALLKGFFLLPAAFSGLPPSPPFPADGFFSPGSSLMALRQFCILLHLVLEAF